MASGGEYKEYQIGELFEKIKTKKLPYKAKELEGQHDAHYCLPALTAGLANQGLAYFVPREGATVLRNAISVSANGANTGVMFYQPEEFTVLQDSYAIEYIAPHAKLGPYAYLYLVTALTKSVRSRYDWSYKAIWERVKLDYITLPTEEDGELAFDFMEASVALIEGDGVEALHAFLQEAGLSDCTPTRAEEMAIERLGKVQWGQFNLLELFGHATRGKRLRGADRIPGALPFITAGEADMGISAYISNPVRVFPANTVTIDMFGSTKYRDFTYGADDHVAVVHTEGLPPLAALFVTAAIHKVAHAGQFSYSRNFYAKDADALVISLPCNEKGEPDYDYMEALMGGLQKRSARQLEKYMLAREAIGCP